MQCNGEETRGFRRWKWLILKRNDICFPSIIIHLGTKKSALNIYYVSHENDWTRTRKTAKFSGQPAHFQDRLITCKNYTNEQTKASFFNKLYDFPLDKRQKVDRRIDR